MEERLKQLVNHVISTKRMCITDTELVSDFDLLVGRSLSGLLPQLSGERKTEQ